MSRILRRPLADADMIAIFRPITDGIEVIRVLHGARDINSILADEFGIATDGNVGSEGEANNAE